MSEISVLSHEYKAAADFSQRFNHALIQVKKYALGFTNHDKSTKKETIAHRKDLALDLESIIHLLKPQQEGASESAKWIPGSLIAHLLKERRGDLDYFLEDLDELAVKLRDPKASLSPEEFSLLDSIAGAADAQTSHVFRRLMRK